MKHNQSTFTEFIVLYSLLLLFFSLNFGLILELSVATEAGLGWWRGMKEKIQVPKGRLDEGICPSHLGR